MVDTAAQNEPINPLESTEAQIFALFISLAATLIAIKILFGLKERNDNVCPGKDYSYLQDYARLNTFLFVVVGIYFTWLAFRLRDKMPQDTSLGWLLAASELALGAAAIRMWQAFTARPTETNLGGEVEQ